MHKWYANFSRFAKRSGPSWKTIIVVLILLKAFGVHFKVLSSFKRRMKECLIRITATDLEEGSKNTSWIKTTRSPAFSC